MDGKCKIFTGGCPYHPINTVKALNGSLHFYTGQRKLKYLTRRALVRAYVLLTMALQLNATVSQCSTLFGLAYGRLLETLVLSHMGYQEKAGHSMSNKAYTGCSWCTTPLSWSSL